MTDMQQVCQPSQKMCLVVIRLAIGVGDGPQQLEHMYPLGFTQLPVEPFGEAVQIVRVLRLVPGQLENISQFLARWAGIY